MNEQLRALAEAAGIEQEYWDALGTRRELDDETATAVLQAMGLLVNPGVVGQGAGTAVYSSSAGGADDGADGRGRGAPVHRGSGHSASAPQRCYLPADLVAGKRCWGVSVQLYALRSTRNWGIGDFADLVALARIAGPMGAALIGLNPMHARHLAQPDAASPYWPSSRLFLDPLYIDVERVDGFVGCAEADAAVRDETFQTTLAALRAEPLVDYRGVTDAKLRVLGILHRHFRSRRATNPALGGEFSTYQMRRGDALVRFAEFEAMRLHCLAGAAASGSWVASSGSSAASAASAAFVPPATSASPASSASSADSTASSWRDGASASWARFRIDAAEAIEFQMYLQWQAELQLDGASAAAREAGMQLSLYRDLAVGAADDSAETWTDPALVASGISIGAPPDLFSRDGQKWGLPPWNPRVLRDRGYAPFAALIAANMRGAAALRIDHVMALARLFWIPAHLPGTRGCYVKNAFDALSAVVAEESARNRCMVVGEDLGSVPDGLRERLHDLGFLSYRVLIFERHWNGDGRFKRPWEYPAQSLAMVATHDMPTIADYWAATDIDRRDRLGLYPEPRLRDDERGRRAAERQGILAMLGELQLMPADPDDPQQIAEALHGVIARTPAMLAVVQLDDVLGEVEPVNIPGTDAEYPNWRRKLSVAIEALTDDGRLMRHATIMKAAGRE